MFIEVSKTKNGGNKMKDIKAISRAYDIVIANDRSTKKKKRELSKALDIVKASINFFK